MKGEDFSMKMQRAKDLVTGAIISALVVGVTPVALAKTGAANIPVQYSNIKVVVDGKELSTSKEPFIYDGTTYLPLRAVAEAVGKEVKWDNAAKVAYLGEKTISSAPKLTETDYLSQLGVKEYMCETYGYYVHVLAVTNNSRDTLRIESNAVSKDESGKVVEAKSASDYAIGSGDTAVLTHYFDEEPAKVEYSLSARKDSYTKSATADIKADISRAGDKLIVSCSNIGSDAANFVKATALFFKNGSLVRTDFTYCTGNDSALAPWNTVVEEIEPYTEFDRYEVYITAKK